MPVKPSFVPIRLVGAAAVGLSLWATLQRRSRLLPLWLVLVICIVWAPGDHLYWVGEPLHQTNRDDGHGCKFIWIVHQPSWPPTDHRERRFGRAAAVEPLMGPKAPWMAAIIALEIGLLSPISPMLPVAPSTAPDVLHEIDELQPGPLWWSPSQVPVSSSRPFLDQRVHGRTLVSDPDNPGFSIGLDPEWKRVRQPVGYRAAHCARSGGTPSLRSPIVIRKSSRHRLDLCPKRLPNHIGVRFGPPSLSGDDGSVWELIR